MAALQAQLAGWATIPPAIVDRLTRDQQAATPPTPLQRWALQLLSDAGTTALAVPNPQPEGSMLLPSWHTQQPFHPLEVSTMTTTQRTTPYQVITDRILTLLEQGTVPWHTALGQRDGAAAQPLQPAAIPGINVGCSRRWAMPPRSGRRSTR